MANSNNFDKAFTKKPARKKEWYMIHGKKWTYPFWLAPIVPFAILEDKIRDWRYNRLVWNEERAQRVLEYAFPNKAEIDRENQSIGRYLRSFWFDWYKFAKRRDKRWCKKFNIQLREYCINTFQMDGYTKEVDIENEEWTWVGFKKNG